MSHTEQIRKATEEEKKSNLSAAASHLRKDAVPDEILNVTLTCDVTWQKRGHQSPYASSDFQPLSSGVPWEINRF